MSALLCAMCQGTVAPDKDFDGYSNFHWLTVATQQYTIKAAGTPHTIHILLDTIVSAEQAVSTQPAWCSCDICVNFNVLHNPDVQSTYNLLLAVTFVHKLSHGIMKVWFSKVITPLGVGTGDPLGFGKIGRHVKGKWMGREPIAV